MTKAIDIPAKRREEKLSTFRYVALDKHGRQVKGTIKAVNEIEAEHLLIEMGYEEMVVEIVPSMFNL